MTSDTHLFVSDVQVPRWSALHLQQRPEHFRLFSDVEDHDDDGGGGGGGDDDDDDNDNNNNNNSNAQC